MHVPYGGLMIASYTHALDVGLPFPTIRSLLAPKSGYNTYALLRLEP
jgi:hypothetical protein